jgi:cytoskeletal protein CcmA (bactofilin family)
MALFSKKPEEQKPVKPQISSANVPGAKIPKAKVSGAKVPSGPKEATYFGKNLTITGNVSGDGDLIILGKLEGEFNLKGKLQVAEPAEIIGSVNANDVTVKGNIKGNITAVQKVHLDPTARVNGQISSPKLSVLEGACFDGEIKMSAQGAYKPASAVADAAFASKTSESSEKNKVTS